MRTIVFYIFIIVAGLWLFSLSRADKIADTASNTNAAVPGNNTSLADLHVPTGFSLSYYAKDVPGARSLAKDEDGNVYVGTRDQGVVYALQDEDANGIADKRYVVASGLNQPNGVTVLNGVLYVAEIHRIIKFPAISSTYTSQPQPQIVSADLPSRTHHGWRYLAAGPDGKLYVSIGAPCNICEVSDPFASIARLNPDGTDFEIIARGVRNSVGFDWSPTDGTLWFTDNGRDHLGDDQPKDELNRLSFDRLHFGFPYCHENNLSDPQYKNRQCKDFEAPALSLSPHAAALGMKFYQGEMFPLEFQQKIFLAEHGSWNRKTPIGYRIMSVDISHGTASNYQVFAQGWLTEDGKVTGRPVDLLELADGSMLISDDLAGAVYRLSYRNP